MAHKQNRPRTFNTSKNVSEKFEKSFLPIPLEKQITACDTSELAPLFKRYLPRNQPILEAGCGAGQWVAWFLNHGWQAAGLDWSEALCARATAGIPNGRFESGDMRSMPFLDGEFGSIVALGSIEHVPEGPDSALTEFHRVLRSDGIAIITVPFNGPIRKILRCLRAPMRRARALPWLRRVFRKPGWNGRSLKEARKETISEWASEFICNDRGWAFYQYLFTKAQMESVLSRNALQIIEEFVVFSDEGIVFNFGRVVGSFDLSKWTVAFSPIGKVLRWVLPPHLVGHMLCYVVQRT